MKIGFATDIHLDHIKENADLTKHRRIGKTLAEGLDALLISGDICNGVDFTRQFGAFHEGAGIPVYFVLGNHDFWGAEDIQVRNNAAQFPGYLDRGQIVDLLGSGIGLCGRTGFYDTLTGNPFESRWHMNDWDRIPRLAGAWSVPQLLQRECKAWAEEETEKAAQVLKAAVGWGFKEVYFVTHFPLFVEACFDSDGVKDTEENGMWPWSIDTTMGHAVREIAALNKSVKFTIFTGHTHGGGEVQIYQNLRCVAGRARYGSPAVSKVWEI